MKRITTKQALTFYENETPVNETYFKRYNETGFYQEDGTGRRYDWINYNDYVRSYANHEIDLWAIGNSNWNLYKEPASDVLYCIPKTDQAWQCQPSCFGTIEYVKRFEWLHGLKCGFTTLDGIEY